MIDFMICEYSAHSKKLETYDVVGIFKNNELVKTINSAYDEDFVNYVKSVKTDPTTNLKYPTSVKGAVTVHNKYVKSVKH